MATKLTAFGGHVRLAAIWKHSLHRIFPLSSIFPYGHQQIQNMAMYYTHYYYDFFKTFMNVFWTYFEAISLKDTSNPDLDKMVILG